MFETRGRQIGVTIPEGQGQQRAPEQTVLQAFECKLVAVQYGDEYGRMREAVVFESNGKYYFPPNAEAWAAALRGCSEWMTNGIIQKLKDSKSPAIPIEDTVDVASSKVAEEAAPQ